jgi:hypothetical protein
VGDEGTEGLGQLAIVVADLDVLRPQHDSVALEPSLLDLPQYAALPLELLLALVDIQSFEAALAAGAGVESGDRRLDRRGNQYQ